VLAANQMALRRDFEARRAGLGIPADRSRAVDVERKQHTDRKLLESWIVPKRLNRLWRGIEISRHAVRAIHHGVFHELGLVVLGIGNSRRRLGRRLPDR